MNLSAFTSLPVPTSLSRVCSPRQVVGKQRRLVVSSATTTVSLTRRAFLLAATTANSATYDAWASRYDALDGRNALTEALGFTSARRSLLSCASGDVLEVGVGTGVNLPLYNHAMLHSLTGVDASSAMLSQAQENANGINAVLVQAVVSQLPFDSHSFDTVVDTFSLCTFGDDTFKGLLEFRRVLRPSGRLLLLEHTASELAPLRTYQDATASVVTALSKGCAWNQRVDELVRDAGFTTVHRETLLAGTVVSLELAAPSK